jgi:hypothetical protein
MHLFISLPLPRMVWGPNQTLFAMGEVGHSMKGTTHIKLLADFKKAWSLSLQSIYGFMVWCLLHWSSFSYLPLLIWIIINQTCFLCPSRQGPQNLKNPQFNLMTRKYIPVLFVIYLFSY